MIGCMVLPYFSTAVFAADAAAATEQALKITGVSTQNITVKDSLDSPSGPVTSGSLQLSNLSFDIDRDYEQECFVQVSNPTDTAYEFYLDVDNPYTDLSVAFIGAGSEGHPTVVGPGESVNVELSAFAQNAERSTYYIPIAAYIKGDADFVEDAQDNVQLNCDLPVLDLDWEQTGSYNSTLRQSYTITNQGDPIADLSVAASDELADYVSFSPAITNLQLGTGEDVSFSVRPDLAKMKREGLTQLSGSLIASSAGKTSTRDVTFDTQGQEITVTTMGELALKQDGNPYSKFELVDDSVKATYTDKDGAVHTMGPDTTFEEAFGDGSEIDLTIASELDLGVDKTLPVELGISSKPYVEGEEINSTPQLTVNNDGSISVNVQVVLSPEEYEALLDGRTDAAVDTLSLLSVGQSRIVEPKPGSKVVSLAFDINTAAGWIEAGSPVTGFIGDVYSVTSMTGNVIAIENDPDYSEQDRVAYEALAILKAGTSLVSKVTSLACPAAAIPVSIMSFVVGKIIGSFMDYILANPSLVQELQGSQCTNRGLLEADFYAPDYPTSSDGDSKPKMHSSSRMYGDGYVDKKDTNYDILLNGDKVGSTETAGVTDVAMVEVPTDNLKPGEKNTLTFDYDTYPGSHHVSTDTEVVLEYPADTEIGYIGTPEDLQEVRALPDFCVYPENVYVKSDNPVVGEKAGLGFKVYNRGSRGGWFTVTCTDGSNEVFQKINEYLPAFSVKEYSLDDWTPQSAESDIKVTVVNTSVGLDERDTSNNEAVTTIKARERQVPSIDELCTGSLVEGHPLSASLVVEHAADLKGISVTLDGTSMDEGVSGPYMDGDTARYRLTSPDVLSSGSHSLVVTATYATASGEQTVSKTFDLTVGAQQFCEISLPEGYSNPSFYVFRYGTRHYISFEQVEGSANIYRGPLEPGMSEGDGYQIVVACDEAVFVTALAPNITLDDSDLHTLTFEVPEGCELKAATINSVDIDGDTCTLLLPLSKTDSIKLAPQLYALSLSGTANGVEFHSTLEVDLSQSDQTLDISDFTRSYEFQIVGSTDTYFSAQLVCINEDEDSRYYYYPMTSYDVDSGLLTCKMGDWYSISKLEQATSAYLIITSSKEAFVVPIAGPDADTASGESPVTLDCSTLNKVSIASTTGDWTITSTNVLWEGISFSLYGNELYLPDGTYDFTVRLSRNGASFVSTITKDVTEDCEIQIDSSAMKTQDLTISWPEPFSQTGSVSAYAPSSGATVYESEFPSGGSIAVEEGQQNVTLNLTCGDRVFTITTDVQVDGDNHALNVGNEFAGTLGFYSYDDHVVNGTLEAWILNSADAQNNMLTSTYDGEALKGLATFIDVNDDSNVFTSEFTTDSIGSMDITLPSEPGTYKLSVELGLGGSGQGEDGTVTVSFDSRGGSAVDTIELTAGDVASRPSNPTRAGYTFAGWFTDPDLTEAYDFSQPVTKDIVLYAKWIPNSSQDRPVVVAPDVPDEHPVTLPEETDGGKVAVDPANARPGDKVTITVEPDEGQKVKELVVTDDEGNVLDVTDNTDGTYTFTMPDAEVTIAVDFICDGGDTCATHSMSDIDHDQWYHEVVDWAVENKIMNGYADGAFGPNDKLYREQAATVLYNYLGDGDESAPAASLSDVDQTQWYAKPLNWAVENKVMNGYAGTDSFGVGDALTREQFCMVVANAVNADLDKVDTSVLDDFPDVDGVSGWARGAVAWAVQTGLLSGGVLSDGTRVLDATRDITRAEMAMMMYNAVETGVFDN